MNAASILIGLVIGLPLGAVAARLLLRGNSAEGGQSEALNEAIIALRDDAEAGRKAALEELARQNELAQENQLKLQQERATTEREAVKNLVAPVEKSLKEVNTRVETMSKDSVESRAKITEMVQNLSQKSERLSESATRLAQAMRSPGARGGWGEKELESLVEAAGMRAHLRNYRTQIQTDDPTDKSRPDMAIAIPGELEMLIDSKVPLEHLLKANETDDPAEREALYDAHADALRTQMLELAKKEYYKKVDRSLDFVVMFVPGDHFLDIALNRRPQLLEEALDKRVILTSPSSFFAVLLAVSATWQQHQLTENAEAIANEGKILYGRLKVMLGHATKMGSSLEKSVEHFNQMINSFDSRLIPSARKMEQMGSGDLAKPVELPPVIDRVPSESRKLAELPESSDDPA